MPGPGSRPAAWVNGHLVLGKSALHHAKAVSRQDMDKADWSQVPDQRPAGPKHKREQPTREEKVVEAESIASITATIASASRRDRA